MERGNAIAATLTEMQGCARDSGGSVKLAVVVFCRMLLVDWLMVLMIVDF